VILVKPALVLFDLDDTLFSESTYLFSVVKNYFSVNGNNVLIPVDFKNRIVTLRQERKDILGAILNDLNMDYSQHHDALFEEYCNHDLRIKPFDGVNELISQLLNLKLRIVVLTNGVIESQASKWKALEIARKDEIHFYIARSLGGDKPREETFESVLSELGYEWNQVVAVGDKLANDISYPVSRGAVGFLLGGNDEGGKHLHDRIQTVENFQDLANKLMQVGIDA
jgi:FMN phosphatase YigB (HAD superfamily)